MFNCLNISNTIDVWQRVFHYIGKVEIGMDSWIPLIVPIITGIFGLLSSLLSIWLGWKLNAEKKDKRQQKDNYESKLAEMKQAHENKISALRTVHDLELEKMQAQLDTQNQIDQNKIAMEFVQDFIKNDPDTRAELRKQFFVQKRSNSTNSKRNVQKKKR